MKLHLVSTAWPMLASGVSNPTAAEFGRHRQDGSGELLDPCRGRAVTKLSACGLLVAMLGVIPGKTHAAPFQNGSFELQSIAPLLIQQINSAAQAPTGWTPAGNFDGVALFLQANGFGGLTVQQGVQAIGFGGNGATGAAIQQSFDTVIGLSYTVSFFTTAQQLGNGPQSFKAEAFTADGLGLLGSLSNSIPVVSSWAGHTFTFVASGGTSLLRFTDTSDGAAAAGINWALDNVSVTAVPEPGQWLLLLGGLGWLAARRRGDAALSRR